MHEPILKNIFRDHGSAIGLSSQHHILRLHIGGKARILLGFHVHCLQVAASGHAYRICGFTNSHAHFLQLLQQRSQMTRLAGGNHQVAASKRTRHDEGARFNAVGNNAMPRSPQFADTSNADRCRARTFDLRAHLIEQGRQI